MTIGERFLGKMRKFNEIFTSEHLPGLRDQLLFSGLSDHEIFMFIQHARPYYLSLARGCTQRIENKFSHMTGLVFSGTAFIYSVDYSGNKSILKTIKSGESSGTLYAMFDYYNTLIEITAGEDCEILFIPPEPMFITDDKLAPIQQKILVNMLASQRQAFLEISEHLACLSKRSIKGKFMHLLQIRCKREHRNEVDLPYSRDGLANYLAVDRASLSRTLGELKREGIIDFRKNHFVLLEPARYNFD